MKTVAVIPAMNESGRLGPVVRDTLKHTDAVIVVDDGSADDTAEAARVSGAVVLRHIINLGKGAALKTGCVAAKRLRAEIIVLLDADGQHDPADIGVLTKAITGGEADIVFGARSLDTGQRMPLLFRFGNWFLSRLVRLFFGIALTDTQSGFRAFRADVFEKIVWESRGYAVETEMITRTGRSGLRFREVPIRTSYPERYKGTTVFDGFSIFWKLIMWRLS